jgi:hypothetical protein
VNPSTTSAQHIGTSTQLFPVITHHSNTREQFDQDFEFGLSTPPLGVISSHVAAVGLQ